MWDTDCKIGDVHFKLNADWLFLSNKCADILSPINDFDYWIIYIAA